MVKPIAPRSVMNRNMRLNQTQKKMMQLRGGKHGMYEDAASVTSTVFIVNIF